MLITLEVLKKRRDSLSHILTMSESELEIIKERTKVIKKEVANIRGAIIEIDHMIDSNE